MGVLVLGATFVGRRLCCRRSRVGGGWVGCRARCTPFGAALPPSGATTIPTPSRRPSERRDPCERAAPRSWPRARATTVFFCFTHPSFSRPLPPAQLHLQRGVRAPRSPPARCVGSAASLDAREKVVAEPHMPPPCAMVVVPIAPSSSTPILGKPYLDRRRAQSELELESKARGTIRVSP